MMQSRCLAILIGLAAAAAPPGALGQPADTRALEVSDRLVAEARRQRTAEEQLTRLLQDFDQVVADLQSNGLDKQGGATQLTAAAKVLESLKDRDVPEAAERLEAARRELEALRPHLDAAGKHVDAIISQLDRLREKSPAGHEQLMRALQAAAHEQEALTQDTKDWGRETFQDPEKAKDQAPTLTAEQEQVARQVKRMQEEIRQAAAEERDPLEKAKLERAMQALQQSQPAEAMDRAAKAVEQQKPLDALKAQERATAGLEAALREMQPDQTFAELNQMREAREQLETIRDEQAALREQTQAKTDEQFAQENLETQATQRQLSQELDAVAAETPGAEAAAAEPVKQAQQAMKQAEAAALAEDRPATTEAQQKAEAALDRAITDLDQRIAQVEASLGGETPTAEQMRQMQAEQEQLAEQTAAAEQQGETTAPMAPAQQALAAQMSELAATQPQNAAAQRAASEMQQAAQAMQANQAAAAQQHQQAAMSQLSQAMAAAAQPQAAPHQAQELAAAAQAVSELADQQAELREQSAEASSDQAEALRQQQHALKAQAEALAEAAQPAANAMKQARQKMGDAEQLLGAGEPKPAAEPQQAAEDALRQAAAQLEQAAAEAQQAMAQNPGPPPPGQEPEERTQEMGAMQAGGSKPDSPDARWRALAQRQRDALDEDYARELPVEYRDLLKDYYEALAE